MVPFCRLRNACVDLALYRKFHAPNFTVGAAFAGFVSPKAVWTSQSRRDATRFNLRHDRIVDLRLRRSPRRPKKNCALAHRHGATLVARPHLAHAIDDSARDFTQRLSARRADDDVDHHSLRRCDGEWDLWSRAPALRAHSHDGAVAG